MAQPSENLIDILSEARKLLSMKGNDFSWSSWEDENAALAEIDTLIDKLKSDKTIDLSDVEILFLPTGPIQEVSLSSGWGASFNKLANRADRAIADIKGK